MYVNNLKTKERLSNHKKKKIPKVSQGGKSKQNKKGKKKRQQKNKCECNA